MTIRLRAEDEPARTRLDYWQHVMNTSFVPYQVDAPGDTFRSEIRQNQIGPLTILDYDASTAMRANRTPDLIRNSDVDLCKIDLGLRGRGRFEQDGRQNLLAPGEFHLIDLSRPSFVNVDEPAEVSIIMFPRTLLPARERDLRDLTTVRFSPEDPYGSLVASMGRELTSHLDGYDGARGARVGAAFLDLLAVAVATRLDHADSVPADSRRLAMLARIRAFVERNLGDPDLSPQMIAAAHHISVRALHKLYADEDQTVAASIRRQRLERCRRDLLDRPGRPVGAVGARWGFPDGTAFSRAFRSAYGLPPGEYRALYLIAGHGQVH